MVNTVYWRAGSYTPYLNDLKFYIVELAPQPNVNVAKISRENGVAHNPLFK
ncbi:transposase-like protein [Serratia sp. BIGb0163]|nr:transposase-like protein [Serratia sp. BIGb0163]